MDEKKVNEMEPFWHTTAHVLAKAVLDLYPGAQNAFGPPVENGFYQDFDISTNVDEEGLRKIEKRMQEIISADHKMVYSEMSIKDALKEFSWNKYKTEAIKDLESNGEKIVSIYTMEKFVDLCKGPHLKSAGEVKAFKLLKTSAAYWKGNEKNKQLQRIYGISFKSQKELDDWIELRKKAEENSNIKLGKELDLFFISELVGRGLPIWSPNGTMIRMQLQDWLVKEQQKRGYKFVITPHICRSELFKTSGHLGHYKDSMYAPMKIDDEEYYLKPMNCPFHIQYYAKDQRSYRDLPMRIGEMGTVYRYEKSGELSGLLRVRGFTQDDAHLFCTPDQIKQEFQGVFEIIILIMNKLKMNNFRIRVGTRDDSDKYIGDKSIWEKAVKDITMVLDGLKIEYKITEGEAAFYGPKADIVINDSLGREWQIGTIQVDYNLPEKFDLEYIGEDGKKHRPVMIHRAPFGSFERFTGILIEHFGGAFPLWLSPEQVRIVPVSDKFMDYAKEVQNVLIDNEIRVKLDDKNETLGNKIRLGQKEKVPYMLVIGGKEVEAKTVAVRDRSGKQDVMPLDKFVERAVKEIKEKI